VAAIACGIGARENAEVAVYKINAQSGEIARWPVPS